jgi:hypothetical protein
VKDPDNGNGAKNDQKSDAEDMSLADLLGGDVTEDADAPKRVDHRADEPDSGMVNLAKMVADSSVEAAKIPSIMPPPAAQQDQTGKTDGTGSVAVAATAPMVAPAPQKKSAGPIYALIAVVIIAAGAVIAYLATREPEGDDEVTKALMAKLEAIEREQQEAETKMAKLEDERRQAEQAQAAAQAKLDALKAADSGELSAEELAKKDALQKEIEEAAAKKEELAQAAAEAEKTATEAKKKAADTKKDVGKKDTGAKVAAADTKKDTAKKDTAKASADELLSDKPSKKDTAKKDTAKKDTAKAGGADELDSLLGNNKKKEEPKEDKPAAPSIPKQLNAAQIKAGMAPIAARAQSACAKYSTGVVQIQVVIGNNGRVKSAAPKGAFASSTAGTCVAMQARTAKFPKFQDDSQTILYPITLK